MKTYTQGAQILLEVEFTRNDPFANPYLFDPASPAVTVRDSSAVKMVNNQALTRNATGKWSCYIQTDGTWIFGIYSVFVTSADGIYSDTEIPACAFMLTGGVAQTARGLMYSDMDLMFDTTEFCETVTYNGVNIPAIVNLGRDLSKEPGITAETALVAMATIEVKKSDMALTPTYRDTVLIDGAAWRMLNIQNGDGLTWLLNLIQDERRAI